MTAPSQSDIIWENIYKDEFCRQIKSWFLVITLFLTCVILVTPISIIENLQPVIEYLQKELGSTNFLAVAI
jgi:hypothetical protein